MVAPFLLAGTGMALVFAPAASAILSAVRSDQAGQASGAANALRELGGVLGITVLATVFAAHGNALSASGFIAGLSPAIWVGTGVLAAGTLLAAVVPLRAPATDARSPEDLSGAVATAPVPGAAG
jgi:hypothetical protein